MSPVPEIAAIYLLSGTGDFSDIGNPTLIHMFKALWVHGAGLVNENSPEVQQCLEAINLINDELLLRGFDSELFRDEVGSYLYAISKGLL